MSRRRARTLEARASIRAHARRLDDLRPAVDLASDERIGIRLRAAGELDALRCERRAKLRVLDRLVDLGVEAIDDGLRSLRRREHHVPRADLETRKAGLGHRRQL